VGCVIASEVKSEVNEGVEGEKDKLRNDEEGDDKKKSY
jgi:hypothetical protein